MAGGFGARPDVDGMDTGGLFCIPMGRIPDVEMTEFLYPLLTLWRREEPDSGGPGRQRGGVSASLAVALHGSSLPAGLVLASAGKAVSQNNGLAGGYPGNTGVDAVARNVDVHALLAEGRIPQSLEELGESIELGNCYAQSYLAPGEVLYMHWQGGGGYGDPLHRDPGSIAADVREGKVTAQAAADIYGVVLRDGAVDAEATDRSRAKLKDVRRERSTGGTRSGGKVDLSRAQRLDDNLVTDGDAVGCAHCGQQLADLSSDTSLGLALHEGPSTEAGPQIGSDPSTYVDDEVVFRQLCCPGCWTAVYSSVVPKAHPDHVSDLSRLAPAGSTS
jgi:N-methylhydantoinase B